MVCSILKEKTPGERADAIKKARESKGPVGKAAETVLYALADETPTSEGTEAKERESGSVYGLSETAQKDVDGLVAEYNLGGEGAANAGKALIQLANMGNRQSIANGVRNTLRDKAKALYAQVKDVPLPK